MSKFEARAHLKVRAGQLEGFKRQASEMMQGANRALFLGGDRPCRGECPDLAR